MSGSGSGSGSNFNSTGRFNKSRFIDLIGGQKYFAGDCGSCVPVKIARFIDILDFGGADVWQVFGLLSECQKSTVAVPEYVFLECGNFSIFLSKILTLHLNRAERCAGEACPDTELVYQEDTQDWRGTLGLANGSLPIIFKMVCDNPLEPPDWILQFFGCALDPDVSGDSAGVPVTLMCEYPPRFFGPIANQINPCCIADASLDVITVEIKSQVKPLYAGRLMDIAAGKEVYAVGECCPKCITGNGCCLGVNIDHNLLFTIHNVVETGSGSCGCTGLTFQLPVGEVCRSALVPSCFLAMTFCLSCDRTTGLAGYDCRNYRLSAGTAAPLTDYAPTACSCDPFSLLFENIPWAFELLIPEFIHCEGTLSITVTR